MIHLFLANGFEEIEALATIDILRRCGLEVATISNTKDKIVVGAHNIRVMADYAFGEISLDESQAIVLPGGMPGAKNLLENVALRDILLTQNNRGGLVAAICAAPMVLGQHGILQGRKATCYPGFENMLVGADVQTALVVDDGNVITGKGPAAAKDFGFAIAARFVSDATVDSVRKGMLYD